MSVRSPLVRTHATDGTSGRRPRQSGASPAVKPLRPAFRILVAVAALALGAAYVLPLWEIQLWAPQYPEGLNMKIWLNRISGDYEVINGINHYIGMRAIKAEMFPEFQILPWLTAGMIAVGLITAITGRRGWLKTFALVLCVSGALGLADYYRWGYDYGHNLDPRAAINVPGMSYQPPLFGYKNLLNFVAYSGPDYGGWVFIAVGAVAVALCGWIWWRERVTEAPS
jgi:copper chaperone NosL